MIAVEIDRTILAADLRVSVAGVDTIGAVEIMDLSKAITGAVDKNSSTLGAVLMEMRDLLDDLEMQARVR